MDSPSITICAPRSGHGHGLTVLCVSPRQLTIVIMIPLYKAILLYCYNTVIIIDEHDKENVCISLI